MDAILLKTAKNVLGEAALTKLLEEAILSKDSPQSNPNFRYLFNSGHFSLSEELIKLFEGQSKTAPLHAPSFTLLDSSFGVKSMEEAVAYKAGFLYSNEVSAQEIASVNSTSADQISAQIKKFVSQRETDARLVVSLQLATCCAFTALEFGVLCAELDKVHKKAYSLLKASYDSSYSKIENFGTSNPNIAKIFGFECLLIDVDGKLHHLTALFNEAQYIYENREDQRGLPYTEIVGVKKESFWSITTSAVSFVGLEVKKIKSGKNNKYPTRMFLIPL